DQRSTKGPLTTRNARKQHERIIGLLIREYLNKGKEEKPIRLLNGDDLIKRFRLSPSPLIGKILSYVEELQAIGKIKDKKDAFEAAAKIIKKDKCTKERK
ncbi:MAG: hypothetical protein FJZ12_03105, partial [Candidatus Omnitrophica bacterium]|nr:hypothetical protein [Candidatus Omnitrophota bacterium]